MPEINLPKKTIINCDLTKKIPHTECNRILIISNSDSFEKCEFICSLIKRYEEIVSYLSLIVNQNLGVIKDATLKSIKAHSIKMIVAIGSAEVIDLAVSIAEKYNIKTTAIPSTVFTQSLLQHGNTVFPDTVVLEKQLTRYVSSDEIAYNSLGCMALAFSALQYTENSILKKLAEDTVCGIYDSIIPSYRGDIAAREKIQVLMYYSVLLYLNTDTADSEINSVLSFFNQFNHSALSIAAICLPEILNASAQHNNHVLADVSRKIMKINYEYNDDMVLDRMIKSLRKMQAVMSIPRALHAWIPDEKFIKAAQSVTDSSELINSCYYGSLQFAKM